MHVITSLNPLGIGEGFEPAQGYIQKYPDCLNPLGIGEGFEPTREESEDYYFSGLNPLGIGEGFEQLQNIHL